MRWLALVTCALGCGRLGFDAKGPGAGDAAGDAGDPLPSRFAYLKASAPSNGALFGVRLAFSADGTTLAVGAYHEASSAGAVYVFVLTAGAWAQQARIAAPNTEAGDQFGLGLALSDDGNTLAVGANREDSAATGIGGDQADNTATDAGAVYVFTRGSTAWLPQAYIKASNTDAGDNFGYQVALSADGNTLAVGAFGEDSAGADPVDNSAAQAGAAYVFTRAGAAWSQQAYVKASNATAGDELGLAIQLSADGNILAVSAPLESSVLSEAGAVYVFTRANVSWSQRDFVKASNPGKTDQFGWDISLSSDGNVLVSGARFESALANDAGAAYVFTYVGGAWSQPAVLEASNARAGDLFGQALALDGAATHLVVTSAMEDSGASGADGDQASASAPDSGAGYIFSRTSATWQQHHYLKATNPGMGDQYGFALAVSRDGRALAVGAIDEDNIATDSGAVYVYY